MTTNVPPYARCAADTCPGHEYDATATYVLEDVLPHDLDDHAAEVAMALAANVALTYAAKDDGHTFKPEITIHKGAMTRLDGREWAATAVRDGAH